MDASSKLLAAGWSPESLRRALLDDVDDEQEVQRNKENIPTTQRKQNIPTIHPSNKGIVIDLTSNTPVKSTSKTYSNEIDGLVWKFNQQSLGTSAASTITQKLKVRASSPTTTTTAAVEVVAAKLSSGQSSSIPPPAAVISTATSTTVANSSSSSSSSSRFDALIKAAKLDETLPNGWKLFPHQKEAILGCLKLGRTIMAFDMGLGKTLIALMWAKAVSSVIPGGCTTLVIVPCTLIEVWRREAMMLGFDVYGQGSLSSKHSISIHSWAKIPEPADIGRKYLLIADEAHAMQSFTSQRTKAALQLCVGK